VARHIERVGDNAGKIAEKAIYMATGERRLDTP
jgi:phosphate uptake regulator